ncbi:DUF4396 domain-containing protein [Mesobacterium pallidum]|uniref:DUF4396 domain-containing protein n=1 Tax=Mesobacterium pallidum TaxID=2872037 RepID=UPI001EE1DC9C|nr:DUF4396 domain-containing protein [Mesobacterium pallidum]
MLHGIAASPWTLALWVALMLPCLAIVVHDLATRNAHLMSLMKVVWVLTVLYSGPLGLGIYWLTGRKEIADDHLWRRSFRSVAHCYSGCGMGEILGVILAAGLLSLGTVWVSVVTFSLAYVFGYALTVGPLVQDGVPLRKALWEAFVAETPSITVMEVTAISVSLLIGGAAGLGDPLFWSALILSLSCGLLTAYPVNVALIHFGVKEGMMDPRDSHHGHGENGRQEHGADPQAGPA